MTTWTQPIRHPWFDPPTMKRKLFTDDDTPRVSTTCSPSPRKRVRYDSLERTLAHMTLGCALPSTSEVVDMWPRISPSHPSEMETLNVVLPSSVEEPGAVPAASEPVDMEVEPISVTTNESDTKASPPFGWDSMATRELDIKEVEISPAVLECLRRQANCTSVPIPLPPQTGQALVLYRTPRPLEQSRTFRVAHEDDVMEVE